MTYTTGQMRKYTFDTVFDASGRVVRDGGGARFSYTPEEVEAARTEARAEGERSQRAIAEHAAAAALAQVVTAARGLIGALATERAALRQEAVALSLAAARAASARALAQFPQDHVTSLFEETADQLREAPRLRIALPSAQMELLEGRLRQAAADVGFDGALVFDARDDLPAGACRLEWGAGAVLADPEAAFAAIEVAADRWLAAQAAADDDTQLSLFD